MAQSRILNYDGNFVTFYYDRHEDGKRVTEKISAIEFITRLMVYIPDEQFKMVRYYGLYAKRHKHSSKFFLLLSPAKKRFLKRHSKWRARILIAFGIDPIRCSCGHIMELVDIFIPEKSSPFLADLPPPAYNVS
ncbi:hypothetical protein GGQ84_003084 [Desulfitispora alkaliphila]